jgi:hypothetical protein
LYGSVDVKVNQPDLWQNPHESDILLGIMAPARRSFPSRVSQGFRSPIFWAAALRLAAFVFYYPIDFRGDAADFDALAANLAAGHGLSRCAAAPFPPTAQRPPLFPVLLSVFYFFGASRLWAAFALNTVLDLLSLRLARLWSAEAGLGDVGARRLAWFVALCPLLVFYAPYPTTENLSFFLFLGASWLTFKGRASDRPGRWGFAGGIAWGCLALCRSYFLLFPALLALIRPSRQWSRKGLALMFACSLIVPSIWVARNHAVFGKPVFSQGAAVGWQAYQGLCVSNFDWWDSRDVARITDHPVLSRMLGSACLSDDRMAELDHQVRQEVWRDCVAGDPAQAALNVAVKGAMLFINWGQFMPYTEIPSALRDWVNAFMALYWIYAAWILARAARGSRSRGGGLGPPATPQVAASARYAILGLLYVAAVTLPFAVDARYLLGPFAVAFAVVMAISGPSAASRRGSRIP